MVVAGVPFVRRLASLAREDDAVALVVEQAYFGGFATEEATTLRDLQEDLRQGTKEG